MTSGNPEKEETEDIEPQLDSNMHTTVSYCKVAQLSLLLSLQVCFVGKPTGYGLLASRPDLKRCLVYYIQEGASTLCALCTANEDTLSGLSRIRLKLQGPLSSEQQ